MIEKRMKATANIVYDNAAAAAGVHFGQSHIKLTASEISKKQRIPVLLFWAAFLCHIRKRDFRRPKAMRALKDEKAEYEGAKNQGSYYKST
ncbi:hypothetical protein RRG08_048678 [Elysia crispata]|uniref:Uncharacterized protein n=1 Tax=Elysia crispata TaxID=231223 RepID=A0AAE1ACY4_9GAST|nr:hypothetical protein RRG08_048678 [Elysia crispata]